MSFTIKYGLVSYLGHHTLRVSLYDGLLPLCSQNIEKLNLFVSIMFNNSVVKLMAKMFSQYYMFLCILYKDNLWKCYYPNIMG